VTKKTRELFRLNLRRLVQNTGRTLPEVAEDCEISLSFLNQLMSGKKSYSQETLDKLCKGLRCAQSDLFFVPGTESKKKEPRKESKNELLGLAVSRLSALNDSQLRYVLGLIDNIEEPSSPATVNTMKLKG
jgi:transcriptional regulator with XRE-family HTH domain